MARHGGVERHVHFEGGGDVNSVDQSRGMLHDGRHGVRLHREIQVHAIGQDFAQMGDPLRDQIAVIGEKRRRPDLTGQTG